MNRIDFMNRLAALLSDISEEERKEAIEYYNDYLNDAGVENEEEVLAALGTPEALAASIREGLKEDAAEAGEFSETGFQKEKREESGYDSRMPERYSGYSTEDAAAKGSAESRTAAGSSASGAQEDLNRRYRSGSAKTKGMSGGMIALLVILGLLAAPIVLPVAFTLVLVLGILAIVAVFLGIMFLFVGVICIIAGVISFFQAITDLFLVPAGAVLSIGMSLITVGIGILLTLAIGWVLTRVFPKAFRAMVNFVSGLVHGKGGKG